MIMAKSDWKNGFIPEQVSLSIGIVRRLNYIQNLTNLISLLPVSFFLHSTIVLILDEDRHYRLFYWIIITNTF